MKNVKNSEQYRSAAEILGCDPEVIMAVALIESRGTGFLPGGKPKILYEPFVFGSRTGDKYNGTKIIISGIFYPLSLTGKWSRQAAVYGGEEIQHIKLNAAIELDEGEALNSCSWGKFQIMGFNYKLCGYDTVGDFVKSMYESEQNHLDSFVQFIKNRGLAHYLRKKDWPGFAKKYNGAGYKANNYAVRLSDAYQKIIRG